MKKTHFAIILVLILGGCYDKKIEITAEYIINENWSKKNEQAANSIRINRMKVKDDSTINPFSSLNQTDILTKLEVDSSFIYSAIVKIKPGNSYKDTRIYFNKDNGFYWWTDHGNRKTKILGKLEKGTWYKISGLTYYYYVIYIDSSEKVHRFVVIPDTNF